MTNHSLINASATTHAKIAFVAIAASVVFMALVQASASKSDLAGARASVPVLKAGATMTAVVGNGGLVR